jgi:hypothetical protein
VKRNIARRAKLPQGDGQSVAAYADIVVAENLFSNLAIQAGLQKKFQTIVTTDLLTLPEQLQQLRGG